MHKIDKFLAKISRTDRAKILSVLLQIKAGNLAGLDVKKLSGISKMYRVRLGKYRIIFKIETKGIFVLSIDLRNDTTYNSL